MKIGLLLFACCWCFASFGQTGYHDEMGRSVSRDYFEKQIVEGPYFGVPYENGGKILVHRMPFGKVDPERFYTLTGNQDALNEGKMLIVIYYPGKDECNSTGLGNNAGTFDKEHKTLLKWASKYDAAPPIYLYSSPSGLEKYKNIILWQQDPEGVFASEFFKYPYPCGSFVVIHPSGNYRAILGEYPLSQIQTSLKVLRREYN
ncbi:hypothetical protein [Algoriphagus namhaensis]